MIYQPNTVRCNGRCVVSDVFLQAGCIVCVLAPSSADCKDVRVTIRDSDGNTIPCTKQVFGQASGAWYDTRLHRVADTSAAGALVTVVCDDGQWRSLPHEFMVHRAGIDSAAHGNPGHSVMVTALLRDDHSSFAGWREYYRRQGCTLFVMYYHGKLHDVHFPAVFDYPDVVVVEWDWAPVDPAGWASAQASQMQHALHMFAKGNFSHVLYCDMGECASTYDGLRLLDLAMGETPGRCYEFRYARPDAAGGQAGPRLEPEVAPLARPGAGRQDGTTASMVCAAAVECVGAPQGVGLARHVVGAMRRQPGCLGQGTTSCPLPVFRTSIPNVIHICYKDKAALDGVRAMWVALNPGYRVVTYGDAECEFFIGRHFPKPVIGLYRALPWGPIKADLWRLCILVRSGGVYVDADIEPLVPLSTWMDPGADMVTSTTYFRTDKHSFNPDILGSVPHHPSLMLCVVQYIQWYQTLPISDYWTWSLMSVLTQNHRLAGYHAPTSGVFRSLDCPGLRTQVVHERGGRSHYDAHKVWAGERIMNNRSQSWDCRQHVFVNTTTSGFHSRYSTTT